MRKGLKLAILGFIAADLAACASPEQQRQTDSAACQQYGFGPGTPDFAACLQREQLARNNNGNTSLGVGVGGGSGGGFGGIGVGFGF